MSGTRPMCRLFQMCCIAWFYKKVGLGAGSDEAYESDTMRVLSTSR